MISGVGDGVLVFVGEGVIVGVSVMVGENSGVCVKVAVTTIISGVQVGKFVSVGYGV